MRGGPGRTVDQTDIESVREEVMDLKKTYTREEMEVEWAKREAILAKELDPEPPDPVTLLEIRHQFQCHRGHAR